MIGSALLSMLYLIINKRFTFVILGYLEPLSAIIFSFIFLDEQLLVGQIIGAVIIISGELCAELQPRKQMLNK